MPAAAQAKREEEEVAEGVEEEGEFGPLPISKLEVGE